jgi:hypothetical protein
MVLLLRPFLTYLFRLLSFRREISQPRSTNDAQIIVHNGQIFEMMLAHDFLCLIQRLIFEAILRFLDDDFAEKRRIGIMAKPCGLPLRVLALHSSSQTIT